MNIIELKNMTRKEKRKEKKEKGKKTHVEKTLEGYHYSYAVFSLWFFGFDDWACRFVRERERDREWFCDSFLLSPLGSYKLYPSLMHICTVQHRKSIQNPDITTSYTTQQHRIQLGISISSTKSKSPKNPRPVK